jgi:hypothetical protein
MNIDDLSKFDYIEILIFVFAIFSFLVIINILGINLNTVPPHTKLIQEVTVESYKNNKNNKNNKRDLNDYGLNDYLNKPLFTNLIEEIMVETFDNPKDKLDLLQEVKNMQLFPIDSFCVSHVGKSSDLEGACERLTKDTCLETNCCVYTSFDKCVAGSQSGPTYLKNNEGIDNYYFKDKKFVKNNKNNNNINE